MRTQSSTANKAARVHHIREAIRAAVALHREWIETHDTDDDTDYVALADILPGVEEWNVTETIKAATSAGFPVGHDEDGLVLFVGVPRVH
jgi:hypothetical protein